MSLLAFSFAFLPFFFWYPFRSACWRRKKVEKNLWHLGFSRRFFLTASMAKGTSHKMLMKGLQTYFVFTRSHEKISQLRNFLSRFLNDFAQFFFWLSYLCTHKTHFLKSAVNLCTLIMQQCIGEIIDKKRQRCRNQTTHSHQQEHGKMFKLWIHHIQKKSCNFYLEMVARHLKKEKKILEIEKKRRRTKKSQ